MLVVIDTNIFLSALISPHGSPALILDAWREKHFLLVTCQEQIDELRKTSRHPKFRTVLQPEKVGVLINKMRRVGLSVEKLTKIHEAADPTDDYLLDLAEASSAHYLVTGDKRAEILGRKKIGIASILTAQDFCRSVLQL